MSGNGPLYAMGGAHPHALARNDAMRGLATGNRAGKPATREQQIHTPECVLNICRHVWPSGIYLDPCASPEHSFATVEYRNRGTEQRWFDRSYINPPYADLKLWLAKSAAELTSGVSEQILLFPVRPNRVWWCDYMRRDGVTAAWLKPLKFVGFYQAFPAPLVLVYTGNHVARFTKAAKPLACWVGGLGGANPQPKKRALAPVGRLQIALFG